MRRTFLGIILAVLLGASAAFGAVTTAFSAKTTAFTSASFDTANATYARIQVFSTAGSTSTTLIEQSTDGAVWYVVATITDASATGEIWSVPSIAYTRIRLSVISAGAVTAKIEVQK